MVVSMFAPKPEGSLRESPPRKLIFDNLIDQNSDAARLLHLVATAMGRATEILRDRLGTTAMIVSPLELMLSKEFQQIVYLLTEVGRSRQIYFAICSPNLRVGRGELRAAALFYHSYIAAFS